ncbi:hypothetical protein, partial [Pseudomonas versuta]|uniref:hypothetical protein n=1 Tax=Pseudomonas versuta TaxID=1788301 RepID=UPI0037C794F9
ALWITIAARPDVAFGNCYKNGGCGGQRSGTLLFARQQLPHRLLPCQLPVFAIKHKPLICK